MKKSLKKLFIVGLVISSNGLVGSEEFKQKLSDTLQDGGIVIISKNDVENLPSDPNANSNTSTGCIQKTVTAAVTNWWYKK